jgi:hypothetical protein
MQFRVPKFLEREATIAFGLTFKKLAVVGAVGLVLFILYYTLPNKLIFFVIALFFGGGVFLFLFVKIKGQSLFTIISRAFGYFLKPKVFFWQKRQGVSRPVKMVQKKEEKKENVLRLAPRSRLHEISSKIDLGN